MILAIFSVLALISFLVLLKLKHQNKTNIMVVMVITMVLANYFNQISSSYQSTKRYGDFQGSYHLQFSRQLCKVYNDNSFLVPQEKKIQQYLNQIIRNKENVIVHFANLNTERFRLIFHNVQKSNENAMAAQISHQDQTLFNLQSIRKQLVKSNKYNFLIIENTPTFDQLTILKNLFLRTKVTLIFQNLGNNFTYHSINDFTQRVETGKNAFYSQLTKSHSPELISKCQKYVDIDYDFYLKSQSSPLVDLCCLDLPRSPSTECIKRKMKDQNHFISVEQANQCLKSGSHRGVIFQNGMVKVDKEHYWAGKCNTKQFLNNQRPQL